jgi:glycosyltransferase involved in cell wall biosynthesis
VTERFEISVVIPTKNRWQLLSRMALPSALAQQGVEHEVVVVDDGSTDRTAEYLSGLGDPRVRVVRRHVSGGMAAARNAGIAVSRGEWIALLDDDDLWAPHKLRTQLDAARRADADFAFGAVVAVDDRRSVLGDLYLPSAEGLARELLGACVIPAGCSNVIVRADVLAHVGGFDEQLRHVADWDLWLRIADRPCVVCDEVLVAYVLHDRNLHAVDDSAEELDYVVRKHAGGDPPRRVAPDRAGYARWSAAQRSRVGRNGDAALMYLRAALTYRSPGNVLRALDALVGKRVSTAGRRLLVVGGGQRPALVDPPEWLRRTAA